MSRFYAEIKGNRGRATRQGFEKSGIFSHTRGWNVGIMAFGFVNDDGNDEFKILLSSGSRGAKKERVLGSYTEKDLEA